MVRYPHTIIINWKSDPVKGSDGDYTPGSDITKQSICRAQVSGEGEYIKGADGNMIKSSFTIFLPRQDYIAPVGAVLEVYEGNTLIASGPLKQMVNKQAYSNIWL